PGRGLGNSGETGHESRVVCDGNGLARKAPAEDVAGGAVELERRASSVWGRRNNVDQQIFAAGRIVGERRRQRDGEDAVLNGGERRVVDRRVGGTDVLREVRAEPVDGGRGGRQRDLEHARGGVSRPAVGVELEIIN